MQLSLNHPTFELKQTVQFTAQSLFNEFGLSYFQYLRCFEDGSASLLTNNTGMLEYFINNRPASPVIFSSFKEEHVASHSYWFMWDEELPSFPVTLARECYQVCNGVTLVRRAKTHYDMIAFALPKPINNAGSFYLNKRPALEEFINRFDRENKNLIQLINKNPFALAEPNRDLNYQAICLNTNRIPVNGKYGKSYLTAKELTCLRFRLQGYSFKQVGDTLELSPRTVETLIQRVKQRTGWINIRDLAWMISACR